MPGSVYFVFLFTNGVISVRSGSVVIGANMPSILAEISFVSNPTDERKMETAEHRQRIAESLYRGVSKYVSGLSGAKVASRIDKPEGE